MQGVAFLKLALGGIEDLATGDARIDRKHSQHVLQLVAESERPAGLVESRPAPDAAGETLVEHPAVEDQVGSQFGRVHL